MVIWLFQRPSPLLSKPDIYLSSHSAHHFGLILAAYLLHLHRLDQDKSSYKLKTIIIIRENWVISN